MRPQHLSRRAPREALLQVTADIADAHAQRLHPQDWLPEWPELDPEPAAREVARRYLAAYGPATREAFASRFGTSSPA